VAAGGRLVRVEANAPAPARVRRRVVADLAAHQPPARQVVPLVQPVHDRLGVEIARGCTRGCRFCQAGYLYRPVRERPPDQVRAAVLEGLAATGLEEAGLLSLSSGDYSCIEPLAGALMDELEPRGGSLSLPSLRVDSLSDGLVEQVKRVRKSGFTLAPEAGSQRLRDAVNKQLSEEQILATVRRVYGLGWHLVKLYFMVGLPGETEDDLAAIGRLCSLVADEARAAGRGRGKKPVVHASLGVFVPKPHTPFQWEAQIGPDEAARRLELARASLGDRRVKAKWSAPAQSALEGALSRGGREMSRALELAAAKGCRFDGWTEELGFPAWQEALAEAGVRLEACLAARSPERPLPWDHIDTGVTREFLLAERRAAARGLATADCRQGRCADCGVCDHQAIKPRLAGEPEPGGPAPPPARPEERTTYRFRLAKTGPARFLGHLEMINQLMRGLQRAGVHLAYSQGFHPHPLVKTSSALPLGVESLVETLAVTVHGRPHPDELARRVNRALPQGLAVSAGRRELPGESLAEPDEVTYLVTSPAELDPGRIEEFRRAESRVVVRQTPKGRRDIDLKANLRELTMEDRALRVTVGREGGRPKPAEILTGVFGLSPEEASSARALKIAAAQAPPAGGG
jgi:radical SAM-linked protein